MAEWAGNWPSGLNGGRGGQIWEMGIHGSGFGRSIEDGKEFPEGQKESASFSRLSLVMTR